MGPPRLIRRSVAVSCAATLCGLVVAAVGLTRPMEGIPPGARFWAVAFFVVLLWPVGLTLVAHLCGERAQVGVAAVLILATVGQVARPLAMPLPENVRWVAPLARVGDAIRYRLPLPAHDAVPWQRAWARAARVAVAVCTEPAAAPAAMTTISVNGEPAVLLDRLHRNAEPRGVGWYELPVSRPVVERAAELDVVLRRESPDGPPTGICGGRTDASRAERSARWQNGSWSATNLPFWYDPPPVTKPERYYIELRFFDARGAPTIAVWY